MLLWFERIRNPYYTGRHFKQCRLASPAASSKLALESLITTHLGADSV